jgi:hypothetical protein
MRFKFNDPYLKALAEIAERNRATMGYVDAQQLFSDAQALTVTAVSTNILDDSQDRNIGIGTPMAIVITVDVAAAGGGTLTISLETDDNSGFSSAATSATTAAIAAAALTAGAQVVLAVPPDVSAERFSRLRYTLATMTGITVTAYRAPLDQVPNAPQYAAGITVS